MKGKWSRLTEVSNRRYELKGSLQCIVPTWREQRETDEFACDTSCNIRYFCLLTDSINTASLANTLGFNSYLEHTEK